MIYKGDIPAPMAPEDEADKTPDEEGEVDESEEEEEEEEATPAPPRRPLPRAQERQQQKRDKGEVTALGAFSISFVFLSLILAPTVGLLFYFARSVDGMLAFFKYSDRIFLAGMGVGVLAAFVVALIFTFKALQHD